MSPVTDELSVGSKWKSSLQTKLAGKLRKGSPNHYRANCEVLCVGHSSCPVSGHTLRSILALMGASRGLTCLVNHKALGASATSCLVSK